MNLLKSFDEHLLQVIRNNSVYEEGDEYKLIEIINNITDIRIKKTVLLDQVLTLYLNNISIGELEELKYFQIEELYNYCNTIAFQKKHLNIYDVIY